MYQLYCQLQSREGVLGALLNALQFAQGVLVGSVADFGREGTQSHKVTLLLLLLLHRGHTDSLDSGGQFTWRKQNRDAAAPLPGCVGRKR